MAWSIKQARRLPDRAVQAARRRWVHWNNDARVAALARPVARAAQPRAGEPPVVFFNASTRLSGMSLNAAYALLASWAVRLEGVPVVHFVCQAGLSRCMLGLNRDDPAALPPCAECVQQSRAIYAEADARWFIQRRDPVLEARLEGLSVPRMEEFEAEGLPLGQLALPSLRWALRRHHLMDDAATRALFRHLILSAARVAVEFTRLLDDVQPRAVVVFNGMAFPEAVARRLARARGIRCVTHEVGLQPLSGYFTTGEATAYPIDIPDSFQLSAEQNARLDAYLEQRFQGNFSMAGVRFWPEMKRLSPEFLERAAAFRQVVPVFTNVIFDTSQPHSNVVFAHMFAWLDEVLALARERRDTLFVIRAHPDESRPGKESRESVADWVRHTGADREPNVLFVASSEFFSSYELIDRSKFVMVYNSTIGLEASILGAAVLCAGKARFTQLPTVFFPQSVEAFRERAREFLSAETVQAPPEFRENARRFLYMQLFRTSLPFDAFIEPDGVWNGYARLKPQTDIVRALRASATLQTVVQGVLRGGDFLLPE